MEDSNTESITSSEFNENISENTPSNGLENFGIDEIEESTPELFNNQDKDSSEEEFKSFEQDKAKDEEDDLEIPAFLRRQKN